MDPFLETLNDLINDSDLSVVEIVGALSLAQQRVAFDAFIQADSEELSEENEVEEEEEEGDDNEF